MNEYQNIESLPSLDLLANFLINEPNAKISIMGYTDTQGGNSYNLNLSKKRVNFVKQHLLLKGVSENSFTIEGKGEKNQITKNIKNGQYIKKSLIYNRRVEFKVLKQGIKTELIIKQIVIPEEFQLETIKER